MLAATLGGWHGARAQSATGPVRQVISGPGLDIDPAVSPDGQTLAYASSRDGNLEIWTRPVGGGPLSQITSSSSSSADRFPSFTPDGRSVVFQSDRVNSTRNIWIVNLGTRALAQLTDFTDGGASHPAVSPDGKTICFTHTSAAGDLTIWLMSIDGRDTREIGPGFDCTWAPAGQIVFARASGSGTPVRADIWMMDINGQHAHTVSQTAQQWCRSPSVSHDGRYLVYTVYGRAFASDIQVVDGGMQIDPELRTSLFVIALGGTDQLAHELVGGASFNSYATWTRDSRTVLFTSTRSGSADVWSVDVPAR